jgi:hypothetical protein
LVEVKRSRSYRIVRELVAKACPSDSWTQDGITFVVFELSHHGDSSVAREDASSVAVFAVSSASQELVAARVVDTLGDNCSVTDLMT